MFVQYTPKSIYEAVGIFANICYQDPYNYRFWNMLDIATIFLPAIKIGQYQIWATKEGQPIAFLTWAELDEETEELLLEQGRLPADAQAWNCGDRLWFVDFVCVHNHARKLIHDYICKSHVFEHFAYGRSIRRNPDKTIKKYGKFVNPHYQPSKV